MKAIKFDRPITQWCYRCEDWEESRKTDCCDLIYPYCHLTIHQDGTTECYMCRRAEQETRND
jgi:hypothetical protein